MNTLAILGSIVAAIVVAIICEDFYNDASIHIYFRVRQANSRLMVIITRIITTLLLPLCYLERIIITLSSVSHKYFIFTQLPSYT